jgi:hypothetical protein
MTGSKTLNQLIKFFSGILNPRAFEINQNLFNKTPQGQIPHLEMNNQ